MTNQKPYHIEQAATLLETGQCQLPVEWSDVAARVAASPSFAQAIKSAYKGSHLMLNLLTETAAVNLCRERDDEL